MGRLGHPCYPVMGNHDFGGTAISQGYAGSLEYYRRNMAPEWYSFDRNGRHVVVLEDNDDASGPQPQLEWLRRDLAQHAVGKQVLVFAHRSLFTQWAPARACSRPSANWPSTTVLRTWVPSIPLFAASAVAAGGAVAAALAAGQLLAP
ncbi:hypothetical protein GCM10017744_071140 [Streptomyces antimycoticus]|uniref:Calcineurin-like phosphoesterase domain-containing protein n=1 Tax=Streptomyces antimycoticus TaxID=68175 RepID=A0A4D4K251_9ACTN|nr:hypothetical protein [Streptomyces antimycoticus]GDY42172.1 hypothetical protein SANT12839_030540 [Streptomyces antimycoticus]